MVAGSRAERPGRFPPEAIDHVIPYTLDCCPDCGGKLRALPKPADVLQQVEIVEKPTIVTEHRGMAYWCRRCQKLHCVPDQAAFRVDFPAWLVLHSHRQQRIALALASGERTQDVARRFRVTPGRISQLRVRFHHSWLVFHGETAEANAGTKAGRAGDRTCRVRPYCRLPKIPLQWGAEVFDA